MPHVVFWEMLRLSSWASDDRSVIRNFPSERLVQMFSFWKYTSTFRLVLCSS
jgi:hypothetical protein